jgi:hypothetical protein
MASRRPQPEIVEALLRAGADVNKPDRSETPLMAAAAFNNLPVVKQLVEAGADLEALEVYPPADGVPRANAYLVRREPGQPRRRGLPPVPGQRTSQAGEGLEAD